MPTLTTLGVSIVNSSLTSVGDLTSLTVDGDITANGNITGDGGTAITGVTSGSFGTLLATTSITVSGGLGISGSVLSNSAGDITLDASGNIYLDSDTGNIFFQDGGTTIADLDLLSAELTIGSSSLSDGGAIKLVDQDGAHVTIKVPQLSSGDSTSYTMLLPSDAPAQGEFLKVETYASNIATLEWASSTGGATSLNDLSDVICNTNPNFLGSLLISPSGSPTIGGLSSASDNIGIGDGVFTVLTNGTGNVIIGDQAGFALTSGSGNTALGKGALDTNSTASFSTAIGQDALGATTAGNNTAVGYQAGLAVISGTNNTFLGAESGGVLQSGSNVTVIGYNADASASNATDEVTLGNGDVETLRCGITAITSLSDARDKTNVIDSPYGLDFVDSLRPVQFTWQRRLLEPADENHSKNGTTRVGFLAQDFLAAMPDNENEVLNLVYKSNPERLEASYGNLIPIMAQAIKDLKAQNDALSARLTALESA